MQQIAKILTQALKRRGKRAVIAAILWLGAGISLPAQAQENAFEALDDIRRAAERHALRSVAIQLSDVQATANNLDSRLRLGKCGQALETFSTATASSARVTVGVRCQGDKPWTLYVPVTIAAMAEVLTLTRPLLRGAVLGEADLQRERRSTTRLPANYSASKQAMLGMQLTRPLKAGTVLTLNMVAEPRLVERGQEVVIVALAGGLEVRMGGVALADGGAGERVPVRNKKSGRTIEALITGAGLVRVRL